MACGAFNWFISAFTTVSAWWALNALARAGDRGVSTRLALPFLATSTVISFITRTAGHVVIGLSVNCS